jgi:ankyrin repeat protein
MQQTILEPLDSPQMARWRINASVLRILIIFGFLFSYLGAQAQGNEFIIAAAKGDLSRVKALIAAKADVNATVDRGLTALMAASLNGHTDVVRILADAHCNVNATTSDGAVDAVGPQIGPPP